MNTIHRNILTVLFSFFGIPLCGLLLNETFSSLGFYKYSGERLLLTRSECDPAEAEPTIFCYQLIVIVGIYISFLVAKILLRKTSVIHSL